MSYTGPHLFEGGVTRPHLLRHAVYRLAQYSHLVSGIHRGPSLIVPWPQALGSERHLPHWRGYAADKQQRQQTGPRDTEKGDEVESRAHLRDERQLTRAGVHPRL